MKQFFSKILVPSFILILIASAFISVDFKLASAQGSIGSNGDPTNSTGINASSPTYQPLKNPLKNANSIGALVKTFVSAISYLAVIAAVLILIYIGFSFVMAQGNPQELAKLKSWLGWTVVGLALIISARLLVDVVINTLSATGVADPQVIESLKKANSGQ